MVTGKSTSGWLHTYAHMSNTSHTLWIFKHMKLSEQVDRNMKEVGEVNGDTYNHILLNTCVRFSNIKIHV